MWPSRRVTAQELAEGKCGLPLCNARLGGSGSLQSCRVTFKSPNLLAVQREWFRQQIFWVTDFSNRPRAGSLRGCAPEACWVDRSEGMPATATEAPEASQARMWLSPGQAGEGGRAGAAAQQALKAVAPCWWAGAVSRVCLSFAYWDRL